jgi:hypothetical protein
MSSCYTFVRALFEFRTCSVSVGLAILTLISRDGVCNVIQLSGPRKDGIVQLSNVPEQKEFTIVYRRQIFCSIRSCFKS